MPRMQDLELSLPGPVLRTPLAENNLEEWDNVSTRSSPLAKTASTYYDSGESYNPEFLSCNALP